MLLPEFKKSLNSFRFIDNCLTAFLPKQPTRIHPLFVDSEGRFYIKMFLCNEIIKNRISYKNCQFILSDRMYVRYIWCPRQKKLITQNL